MKKNRRFYICLSCEIALLTSNNLTETGACANCGDNSVAEAVIISDHPLTLGPNVGSRLDKQE